ncbi:hypothetical protein M426DRAFT_21322 [Hypoxylon sp. CI-4A]|nr:hypothetical protein M426DRAFT_21322 [Hypoxylon sp. CI-4A]
MAARSTHQVLDAMFSGRELELRKELADLEEYISDAIKSEEDIQAQVNAFKPDEYPSQEIRRMVRDNMEGHLRRAKESREALERKSDRLEKELAILKGKEGK